MSKYDIGYSAALDKGVAAIKVLLTRLAASGNYVANKEVNPTKVTFANGRVVRIVRGHLVVEWSRKP